MVAMIGGEMRQRGAKRIASMFFVFLFLFEHE